MENQPEAFLSYTRLDDEFFGGAITAFRRLLELAVRVVTGDRDFNIFQDVDGIEFGQKWEGRLDEAISTSRFLIPIITPLFFKSEPCRAELDRFLKHEKDLGRSDLILPIYYVTAPVLEKVDLLQEDSLASEIASRQRHDWRVNADLPTGDPQIRPAVRKLAEEIGTAMARHHVPAKKGVTTSSDAEVSQLIRNIAQERKANSDRKLVLWVDDRPQNNEWERKSMAAYNMDFVLALSTDEALGELRKAKNEGHQFDVIISDMGRPPDSRAGYTLLNAVRSSGDRTPFFIYAGSRAAAHVKEATDLGAQGTTNLGDELLEMVLKSVSKS